MITILDQVLKPEDIAGIHAALDRGEFLPGEQTAGWAAQSVKSNLQWQAPADLEQRLNDTLTTALASHPNFATTTYAKTLAPFLLSESRDKGGYGAHVDDALMGADCIRRTDISCTVFLSEPDSYAGGELKMQLGGASFSYKLRAGQAIVYPSTTLHSVEPVTAGVRRVAVTWMESYIRQADQREMLHDLDRARREIMARDGKSEAFDLVSKTHANLLRRWAGS